ncbi:MAG TPA: hypothetical protein VND94_00895 [Terriglobia bacterium]|nr:hypothetical protein [Terriglobia bacterium]
MEFKWTGDWRDQATISLSYEEANHLACVAVFGIEVTKILESDGKATTDEIEEALTAKRFVLMMDQDTAEPFDCYAGSLELPPAGEA